MPERDICAPERCVVSYAYFHVTEGVREAKIIASYAHEWRSAL